MHGGAQVARADEDFAVAVGKQLRGDERPCTLHGKH